MNEREKQRQQYAERKQSRMHPSGKFDFETDPNDCDGEGFIENPDGTIRTCYGNKCH